MNNITRHHHPDSRHRTRHVARSPARIETMNIRKKRLEHLERMTKTELESISTQELVISVLKKSLPA